MKEFREKIIFALLGGLISFGSVFFTQKITYDSNRSEEQKRNRIEILNSIIKSLNERVHYSYVLYKNKRDKKFNSTEDDNLNYKNSVKDWNVNYTLYKAQLKYYFSENLAKEFENNLYNKSVKLGNKIYYDSIYNHKDISTQYLTLKNNIENYSVKMYNFIETETD